MTGVPHLTAAQMREADRRCIEEIGIPGAVLMNNAGAAVFAQVDSGPVGIVCGKGNNGGDGYVVARYALLAGMSPRVVVLSDRAVIRGDARLYLEAFENLGGGVLYVPEEGGAERAVTALADCAVLVDAILGTGITGEVRGVARAAIEAWPSVPTIAVDLPSGMNADTGAACGACIRATTTVTMQFPKRGFESEEARAYLGTLVVADIGIPAICADDARWRAR